MPSATGSVQEACGFGNAAAVAGVRDVDQALAAGADRREQRVVAEPRDLDADLLGGADHQGVLGDADLDAVDGQRDEIGLVVFSGACVMRELLRGRRGWRRPGRTGSRRCVRWARYSSRKYLIELGIGLTAPSASAQNERPRMLSHWSSSRSRSASLPCPARAWRASAPATRCPRGTACTCRRTRACRTRSSAAPPGPRRWSRRRSAARGCRASSRPRRRPRSRGVRRGARRSAAGCWSRRASRTSARGPRGCRRPGRSARAA